MNFIGLFLLAGVILKSALAEEASRNVSKIERFLYDRCRVYATDASAYDDVKNHFAQFSDYLSYTASLLPNGKEQFCVDEKNRLIGLMRQLATDMKSCFPKQEKYLPKFLYESFSEFLIFACKDKNIENFFSTQGSDCRMALKNQRAGQEVSDCFRKLFSNFDGVIKKDDLCLNLKLAKTCFGEALARYCPNFAGYESLNNKFFDAIRQPCNSAVSFGIGSFALVIIALMPTKLFS